MPLVAVDTQKYPVVVEVSRNLEAGRNHVADMVGRTVVVLVRIVVVVVAR